MILYFLSSRLSTFRSTLYFPPFYFLAPSHLVGLFGVDRWSHVCAQLWQLLHSAAADCDVALQSLS